MVDKIENIKDIPNTNLECRDLGHGWTHVTDHNILSDAKGDIIQITRWQRCFRCRCERHQTMSIPDFIVLKTKMNYPDQYLMKKGSTRVTRRDARREYFSRSIQGGTK